MSDKLYVRRFNPMFDLDDLNSWLIARSHPEAKIEDLAGIGFICLEERKTEDDFPVAVAFLRRCEGGFGILDSLATNPDASSKLRHLAIDLTVGRIINKAKSYNMRHLLAWSLDAGTLERSERHGFVQPPHVLITRSL